MAFQDSPCEGAAQSEQVNIKTSKATAAPGSTSAASESVFKDAMARGDYDKALSFAVTPQQKEQALHQKTQKDAVVNSCLYGQRKRQPIHTGRVVRSNIGRKHLKPVTMLRVDKAKRSE